MKTLTASAAAFVVLTAVGCERERENLSVHQRIRDAFADVPGLAAVDVDVGVSEIELEGVVPDEALKARAAQIAARIAPGMTIENKLVVGPVGDVNRDLGYEIKEFFGRGLDWVRDVEIRREGDRIVIDGVVGTEADRLRAERRAAELARERGLDGVESRIRVRGE